MQAALAAERMMRQALDGKFVSLTRDDEVIVRKVAPDFMPKYARLTQRERDAIDLERRPFTTGEDNVIIRLSRAGSGARRISRHVQRSVGSINYRIHWLRQKGRL